MSRAIYEWAIGMGADPDDVKIRIAPDGSISPVLLEPDATSPEADITSALSRRTFVAQPSKETDVRPDPTDPHSTLTPEQRRERDEETANWDRFVANLETIDPELVRRVLAARELVAKIYTGEDLATLVGREVWIAYHREKQPDESWSVFLDSVGLRAALQWPEVEPMPIEHTDDTPQLPPEDQIQ